MKPVDEITPEMIEAGEDAILREVGGSTDLGGHFSASALAVSVFRAMLQVMPARSRPEESKPQPQPGQRPRRQRRRRI